jgi:DNA-directed RNA polymerase subunit RPC12/RpoP
MDEVISAGQLSEFFAWAPLFLGVVIYFVAWLSKRHEVHEAPATGHVPTYACAACGKRGAAEHMVPQTHEGAVSYYCANCARG